MPYRVSGACVEKQTDAGWETVKCHETAAQAERHLAALNINVMADEKGKVMADTAQKGMALYTQAEVNYTDYAVRRNPVNAVCQTCRWFSKAHITDDGTVEHFCHIVEPYPLEIVATGYCEKWSERPAVKPDIDDTQETEAVGVEVETDAMGDDEDGLPIPLRAALSEGAAMADDMEARTIGRYPSKQALADAAKTAETYTVKALGDGLWVAAFSNNFKDRQGEIISEAAFDRYLSRVQRGAVPMPELWVWHTAGTRAGKALWVDKAGHIVYAVGKFDDTPQGRALEATMQRAKAGEFTLSHGFTYESWALKEGVYHDLNVFEISVLPVGAEANPYTAITAIREDSKMLTDEKKQFFTRVFGERAGEVIKLAENFEKAGKAIADAGVQYKEYADYTPPVETGAKAANDDVETGYKDLVLDVVTSQGAVLTEVNAMQLALNKALGELASLKALIAEGVTKAGQGTPLPDNDATAAAAKSVTQKQTPELSGLETLFPGMFTK